MGSLAGIGLIAAAVVWFIMKKKRAGTATATSSNGYPDPSSYPKYEHPPPVSPGPMSPPPQMLYNPSDPSTFPTAVQGPSYGGGSSGYPQTTSYDPQAQWRGHYSGAPEV